MSSLKNLLESAKKNNINYLSDISSKWYYSQLGSMSESSRNTIKKEILNYEDIPVFRRGRFYHFDYLPTQRGDRIYESYDRKPLVLFLKVEEGLLHGLNINYLPINKRIPFINKVYRYLVGDIEATSFQNRIGLTYSMMQKNKSFIEHKVIYRKYLINRAKNIKIVPLKYLKIISVMENSRFPTSEDTIYKDVLVRMKEERIKQTRKERKTI